MSKAQSPLQWKISLKESKKEPCGKFPSLCTLTGQVSEYSVDLMKPLVSSLWGWTCHRVCGAFSLSAPTNPQEGKMLISKPGIFSSSAELWDLKWICAKEIVGLMDATKISVGNIWKTSLWGWAFTPAKETLLGNYRHSCICCWVQPCTPFCRTLDGITDTEKISGCSSKISAGFPLTPTSVWISEGVSFCHICSGILLRVKSIFQTPDFWL